MKGFETRATKGGIGIRTPGKKECPAMKGFETRQLRRG